MQGTLEDEQENFALMAYSNSGSDTEMSTRDKSGLGYGNQIHEGVLSYEKEVFESVFDSRSSNVEDSPMNDRFEKVEGMHVVPPLMTGNYMPPKSDFGIDDVETLESVLEPVVVEPKVVSQPKVWSDAPIIEEYESDGDDEYVIKPSEEQEKPTFAFVNIVKHVKTHRETVKEQTTCSPSPKANKRDWNGLISKRLGLGYGFTKKACFVCGSFSHLIRDCGFHEERMAKQFELKKKKGKGTGQRKNRPVWNNVQILNHQNKFVPKAVLTKTSIFLVNTARQNLSSQATETSTAREVNTARPIDDPQKALKNKGNIATAIICLATTRTLNFSKFIFVAKEAASTPHESPLQSVHSLGRDEGSLSLHELTVLCTNLSNKVTSLEAELAQTKQTYGTALIKLIKKVKKLEQTVKTSQSRRRTRVVLSDEEEVYEDPSKQGRSLIEDLDLDDDISLVPPHDAEIQEKISDDTEVLLDEEETDELLSLWKIKEVVKKGNKRSAEKRKDKGKEIMIEDESIQNKSKKQLEQERLSHEEAIRLQEQINEEERKRIARDAKIAKQLQEEYDKDGNKEAIAKVDTTHEGYKMKDFKGMSYDDIRPIFEKVWDQVHLFVPMDSEEEVQRLKRAVQDVKSKPAKRQRTEEVSESVQEQTDEDPKIDELPKLITARPKLSTNSTKIDSIKLEAMVKERRIFKCWFHYHITNGHQFTMSNRHQELASLEQMASALAILEQMATGKEISNPFMARGLPKTTWPTVLVVAPDLTSPSTSQLPWSICLVLARARLASAPIPCLGKRLGPPPSIAVVSASEPFHIMTLGHASISGRSLYFGVACGLFSAAVSGHAGMSRAEVLWRQVYLLDILARSALARDVEYDQILEDDFGSATHSEEINLTLFPLAPGSYHVPYPYEGVSSPLYTKKEWDRPYISECNILCKDIFKDPDVRRKALDRTITPAELRRTKSLLPLELSNRVNVLSALLVSPGYELNSRYTNLVSFSAHLQEKLDKKKGDVKLLHSEVTSCKEIVMLWVRRIRSCALRGMLLLRR
ncbi:hypothetical protein Tco_1457745 [Tanacetum coccineum]